MKHPSCTDEKCGKPATMLVKPHSHAFELPFCQQHGESMVRALNSQKEPHTVHFMAAQPTAEEGLRATVGTQEAELTQLRAELTKLRPLKDQHDELVQLRAEVTKLRGQ